MLYLANKNLLFIHIPKTGGETIRHILNKYAEENKAEISDFGGYREYNYQKIDGSHICFASSKYFLPHINYQDVKVLASVRNPYDRIYSAFVWCQQKKEHNSLHLKDFKTFIKEHLAKLISWQHNHYIKNEYFHYLGIHFMPMYLFLLTEDRTIKYDYLIKTEEISDQLKKVFNELSIPADSNTCINCLKQTNIKLHQYLNEYDNECISIINKIYYYDFKFFGYTTIDHL